MQPKGRQTPGAALKESLLAARRASSAHAALLLPQVALSAFSSGVTVNFFTCVRGTSVKASYQALSTGPSHTFLVGLGRVLVLALAAVVGPCAAAEGPGLSTAGPTLTPSELAFRTTSVPVGMSVFYFADLQAYNWLVVTPISGRRVDSRTSSSSQVTKTTFSCLALTPAPQRSVTMPFAIERKPQSSVSAHPGVTDAAAHGRG